MLGVEFRHCSRDGESPVAALGYIFVVPEGKHEFVACFCVLGCAETAFGGPLTEAKVREGGGHDVEGGAVGLIEEGEDVLDFNEGPWPWDTC